MSLYTGDKGDERKDRELTKDELMQKVLGKRRDFAFPADEEMGRDNSGNESSKLMISAEKKRPTSFDIEKQLAALNQYNNQKIRDITEANALESSGTAGWSATKDAVEDSAKILDDIAEQVDIRALRAEIERDFGVFPSFQTKGWEGNPSRCLESKSEISASNPSKEVGSSAVSSLSFSSSKQLSLNGQSPSSLWKSCSTERVPVLMKELTAELQETVLGQDQAAEAMVASFLRPYLLQTEVGDGVRNTLYITGSKGSGKHFLLKEGIRVIQGTLLHRNGFLTLDMSEYAESSKKNVFLQDIYSALVSDNPFVIIENYHLSSSVINRMMGDLVKDGRIRLDSRYILKNGTLQETAKTLHSSYLSELSGNGKFIVFLTEKSAGDLVKVYGKDVAETVLDVAQTRPFSRELAERILLGLLDKFQYEVSQMLQAEVVVDSSFKTALLDSYETFHGVHSFLDVIDELRRKIAEDAISHHGQRIRLFAEEGQFKQDIAGTIYLLSSKNAELVAVKEDIEKIVGLEVVKNHLYAMERFVATSAIRRKKGLRSDEIARHMIFTGNPGTGKTTIARIIARLMKAIGALSQGHLVEVSRADLVGRYSGHTAPLTMNVIKSALGGVLFIDEAYSLYRGKDDAFGLEAIDTLVKGIEDYRDDLMVILAGYSDEMDVFLSSNSGLKSRFPKIVHFDDYDGDDLLKIALTIAEKKDYVVDYKVLLPLKEYLAEANKQECSNGRLARNVIEAAIVKQSGRVTGMESERGLRTLCQKDFDF